MSKSTHIQVNWFLYYLHAGCLGASTILACRNVTGRAKSKYNMLPWRFLSYLSLIVRVLQAQNTFSRIQRPLNIALKKNSHICVRKERLWQSLIYRFCIPKRRQRLLKTIKALGFPSSKCMCSPLMDVIYNSLLGKTGSMTSLPHILLSINIILHDFFYFKKKQRN